MPHTRASSLALAALLLSACGSSSAQKIDNPFPKQESFEQLTSAPISDDLIDYNGLSVPSWPLQGPFPDQIMGASLQVTTPWTSLLTQGTSANAHVLATQAMACATREVGLFMLAHDMAATSDALDAFIHTRCGLTTSSSFGTLYYTFEKSEPAPLTLEDLHSAFPGKLTQAIKERAQKLEHAEMGIWFGQDASKAVVLVMHASSRLRLDPIPMNPPKGSPLVLRGTLYTPANAVSASVTQGEFGYERCATNPEVDLPAFEITCETSPEDALANFSISTQRKNSIFSSQALGQQVRPGQADTGDAVFEASPKLQLLQDAQVEATERQDRALAYVNIIRKAAGLAPLRLELKQSQVVVDALPHLLEAFKNEDDDAANTLTMGMMAGWDIQGPLLDASFRIHHHDASQDIMQTLGDMLDDPNGRATLLTPEATTLSLGLFEEDSRSVTMALVHAFLPSATHGKRAKRARAAFSKARLAKDKTPFTRSKKLRGTASRFAERVTTGKWTIEQAAEMLASKAAKSYDQPVTYYTYFVHDLDTLLPPKGIMSAKAPEGIIMIAPFKPQGYPWTVYGVVVVLPKSALKK